MDKSGKLLSFAMMALVFVVFYFATGNQNAIESTVTSLGLVGVATALTWAVAREHKKRGRMAV